MNVMTADSSRDHARRAQPESFRARSVAPSLTCDDLEASLAWYTEALGFTIVQRYERGGALRAVSLAAGSVRMLLTQDDFAKGHDRAKGLGFSLMLTTAQDVDQIADRVRSSGTKLETEPAEQFGARVFRVRDPDGFLLVISAEREQG